MNFLLTFVFLWFPGVIFAQGLTIATYNVQNLDPQREDIAKVDGQLPRHVDDDRARFTLLGQHIAKVLNSPDIIALQEVQDNDGAEISDVVNADLTGKTLIEAIRAWGGATYIYRDIPPKNGTSGGQPGGNIRVGFLYNPDRVQLKELQTLDHPAYRQSRLPLVGKFRDQKGILYTVVNLHLASKRGGEPANQTRSLQAEVVHNFVKPLSRVIVLGDINDTPPSPAAKALGQFLVNLTDRIPFSRRFTYSFRGRREMIDQIFVSPDLAPGATIETFNLNIAPNGQKTDRASDHNPVLAILNSL